MPFKLPRYNHVTGHGESHDFCLTEDVTMLEELIEQISIILTACPMNDNKELYRTVRDIKVILKIKEDADGN